MVLKRVIIRFGPTQAELSWYQIISKVRLVPTNNESIGTKSIQAPKLVPQFPNKPGFPPSKHPKKTKQKTAGTNRRFSNSIRLSFLRDNLFLVVASASLANSVRHHQCAALAALNKIGSSHLPVCSSAVSSGFRMFILRTNSTHVTYTSLWSIARTASSEARIVKL